MEKNLIAKSALMIHVPQARVWSALVEPEAIKQYMFGTNVVTDWKPGSPIVWKGEWQGKSYEDKGKILKVEPEQLLQYSHFSPLTGQPDTPENYHTVTMALVGHGEETRVTVTQDQNKTEEERNHSQENWNGMLEALKEYLEK
ncbi:MAG: SRPBCC family protein [Caldilineaceae bacterium]